PPPPRVGLLLAVLAAHPDILRHLDLGRRRRRAGILDGAAERATVGHGDGLVGPRLPRAPQRGESERDGQGAALHRGSLPCFVWVDVTVWRAARRARPPRSGKP